MVVRRALATVGVWFTREAVAALALTVCSCCAFGPREPGEADGITAAASTIGVCSTRRRDGGLFTLRAGAEIARAVGIRFALGTEAAFAAGSVVTGSAITIGDALAGSPRVTRPAIASFAIVTHAIFVSEAGNTLCSSHAGVRLAGISRAVAGALTRGVDRSAFTEPVATSLAETVGVRETAIGRVPERAAIVSAFRSDALLICRARITHRPRSAGVGCGAVVGETIGVCLARGIQRRKRTSLVDANLRRAVGRGLANL